VVSALAVEGLNKSAIAQAMRITWNTVHRWLERTGAWCRRFNDRKIRQLSIAELQADEIQTIVGGKDRPLWIFVVLDVWSRLWPSMMVGKRSYRNTLDLFRNLSDRMNRAVIPLIITDGFQFYEKVIGRMFGPARVVRVEGKALIGAGGLRRALLDSEDSETLHTSFVERLNLTLRQGSAYLGRRTPGQARGREHLDDHLDLLRYHYKFVRPHRALKFGGEFRTLAMQAGLTNKRLTFREIFSSTMHFGALPSVTFLFFDSAMLVDVGDWRFSMAA
jgi:IS1 family transposase